MNITFQPIGFIESEMKKVEETYVCCEKGLKAKNVGRVRLLKKYVDGLKELGECSHVWVIYWLNEIKRVELVTHPGPKSVKNLPRVGVFASRSQYRPNPIALRLARLVKVEKNVLTVEGLDGIDGSPVLDIKPYVSGFDRPKRYKEASWYKWL